LNNVFKQLALLKRKNWIMTLAVMALIIIGVLFIYSASAASDDPRLRMLYKKQIVWLCVGLLAYVTFALVDYRSLRKMAWGGYLFSLAMLVLVLFVGEEIHGAKRSIAIPGLRIQPSELAKIAVILLLARRLSRPGKNLGSASSVFGVLALVAVPVILIFIEPDLGTAMVFLPLMFIMMFVSGVPYRVLALLIAAGLALVAVVLAIMFVPQKLGASPETEAAIMNAVGISEYQRKRITVYLNPDSDPLGAGWNKRQSEIAVGSGGKFGKGFLEGTQNILGYLPEYVAPTDFIFSVIAEEKGFLGSATILFLFATIVGCGVMTALAAPDKLGRLLCVGVVACIMSHALINIAMTVGLMPITGLPLPLLSYGGSFMVVTMVALGIVQSVHIRSKEPGLTFEQGGLWQMG
jgi:rod shape determining protein RodA